MEQKPADIKTKPKDGFDVNPENKIIDSLDKDTQSNKVSKAVDVIIEGKDYSQMDFMEKQGRETMDMFEAIKSVKLFVDKLGEVFVSIEKSAQPNREYPGVELKIWKQRPTMDAEDNKTKEKALHYGGDKDLLMRNSTSTYESALEMFDWQINNGEYEVEVISDNDVDKMEADEHGNIKVGMHYFKKGEKHYLTTTKSKLISVKKKSN